MTNIHRNLLSIFLLTAASLSLGVASVQANAAAEELNIRSARELQTLYKKSNPVATGIENYTINPVHTFPAFEIIHFGFTSQRGRFDKVSGKIALDTSARKGSVEIVIDTASLDMGSASWTALFSAEEFFNVKTYPKLTFKSDHLIFNSKDRVVAAEGALTFIGITKPVLVAVSDFNCGINPKNMKPLCTGNVAAEIKRSDFGLNKYLGAVDDIIKINVPVEAYMTKT